MKNAQMAISADFLAAFAKLPSQQQRGIRSMISRFERDSAASGLNYERINNAKDPNMRSLRIDGGYRAIVLKPATGNVHIILWAAKHDDAYDWATRHACSINAETGALQVYQPRTPTAQTDATATADKPGLFAGLRRRELLRLGVPEAMLDEVQAAASEEAFEAMAQRLPAEAYDGLFLYMAGDSYEDILRDREAPVGPVDTADFAAALGRDDSRARFVTIKDDLELEAMFNAPLERWRVFLHSSQRRLVERHWNGPVRVLGGAGTGKTVVAMHRARWLSRQLGDGERILFTTFTRNLAADIENNLRMICTPEETRRIEVTNLDRWVQGFLRGKGLRFRPVFRRDEEAWEAAIERAPNTPDLPNSFFDDEWTRVIQEAGVGSRDEYLLVPRTGRGVRLNRAMRAALWPVFEEYRAGLAERNAMELPDCYRAAAALLGQAEAGPPYRCVIVDEAQDFGAPAWRLIRAMAEPRQDDLFIVGDAHQRIYSTQPVVLGRCGIEIRGRGRKLRLNYRTTEQTRRWAASLLAGHAVEDLDGGADDDRAVRSIAAGPEPTARHFESREQQATWIVRYLAALTDSGESLRGVCVVARTRGERDAVAEELHAADVDVEVLEADAPDETSAGVRLATMHRVKGLEFDRMVVVSVNRSLVPLPAAVQPLSGPERAAAETGERALLYVAATRAKKELAILSFGEQSRFLT